jgi:hypothetical protein
MRCGVACAHGVRTAFFHALPGTTFALSTATNFVEEDPCRSRVRLV